MVEKTTRSASSETLQEIQISFNTEFSWIESLIHYRIKELCEEEISHEIPAIPLLEFGVNAYFDELIHSEVTVLERIALSLALMARTMPQFLDFLYTKNKFTDQIFTEFGMQVDASSSRIIPTWRTAFFLFCGNNTNAQFELVFHVHNDHRLYAQKFLEFPERRPSNPFDTPLLITNERFHQWLYPTSSRFLANEEFPAHEISSPLEWSDLFLHDSTRKGIEEVRLWLQHEHNLRQNPKLDRHLNLGMRVLFYGPSGTGKTLTASLLGKQFNMPVYRVDLSQMISKWVGETEKNLARVFDIAENNKWILFFDEADALFSKRGSVSDSNDRRSNQEISYLLQRVEDYNGTIVMATNLKDNIDEAFARRFQQVIEFPMPDKFIRAEMWKQLLKDTFPLDADVDLDQVGKEFELTGGSMKNIFRSIMLNVFDRKVDEQLIRMRDIRSAIEQELIKTGEYIIQKKY